MVTAYLGESDIYTIGAVDRGQWLGTTVAILRKVGMPEKLMPFMLAQVMHESEWGTSPLSLLHNNMSGIKPNKAGHQNGTVKIGSVTYGTYPTRTAWASDYKRVLSLSPGRPIDATGAQDFYTRLKQNHYFEDPHYDTKFNRVLAQVNSLLANPVDSGVESGKNEGTAALKEDKGKGVIQFVEDHPVASAAVAITALLLIKSLNS